MGNLHNFCNNVCHDAARQTSVIARNLSVDSAMAQAALLNTRGDLLARLGRADASLIKIGHSLAAYRAMPLPRREADALTNLAEAYLKLGRFAEAIQHSASAKKIINEYQLKDHERKLHRLFTKTHEKIDAPLLLLRIPQTNVRLRRHFFLKSERGERGIDSALLFPREQVRKRVARLDASAK